MRAQVHPGPNFQGFDGILHGGIVTALLDDAMWYAVFAQGSVTLTAEIGVHFKKPAPADSDLVVKGRVIDQRRNLFRCAAILLGPDGGEVAEASGKFLISRHGTGTG